METINTGAVASGKAADTAVPTTPAAVGSVSVHGDDDGGLFGTILAVLAGEDASDQQQDTSPTSGDASQLALAAALLAAINPQNPETPPVGGAALPIADGKTSGTTGAVAALAVEPATAQIAVGTVASSVSQGRPVLTPAAPSEQAPAVVTMTAMPADASPGQASAQRTGAQKGPQTQGNDTSSSDLSMPQEIQEILTADASSLSLRPHGAAAETGLAMPQTKTEATGPAAVTVMDIAPERASAQRNNLPEVSGTHDNATPVSALSASRAIAPSGTIANDPLKLHGATAETLITKPQAKTEAAGPPAAPGRTAELPRAAPAPPEHVAGEQTRQNAGISHGTIAVAAEEEERRTTGVNRQPVEPLTPAGPESAPFGGERLAAEFLPSPAPASHGPEVVLPAPKSLQPGHDAAPTVAAGPQRETIQIQLPPSDMGRVTMQVSVQARQVHAAVTVEHRGLGELLAAGQGSLDDAMKRHGLQMEEFRVDTLDTPADRGGSWQFGHEPSGFQERHDAASIRNTEAGAVGTAAAPPVEEAADGAALQRINLFV